MLVYNSDLHVKALGSPVLPVVEVDIPVGDPVLAVDHPDGGVYGRMVAYGDRSPVEIEDQPVDEYSYLLVGHWRVGHLDQ